MSDNIKPIRPELGPPQAFFEMLKKCRLAVGIGLIELSRELSAYPEVEVFSADDLADIEEGWMDPPLSLSFYLALFEVLQVDVITARKMVNAAVAQLGVELQEDVPMHFL